MFQNKKMVAEFDAATTPYHTKVDAMVRDTRRWRDESEAGFRTVDQGAEKARLSLGKVFLATTALGGGAAVSAMLAYSDTAKQMGNQLQAIGAGADEMKKKVFALAIETRTPIEATVGLLRNMQKSLKDQSLDQTIRQVGTLNRLLTIGGLDSASRGSVALQFGQALQSGILAGDELRALREAAPIELLEAIAKAGGGTVETLRKMGSESKLTRDVMVKALEDLEATSIEKFANFNMTLGEASEALRTSIIAVAAEFNEGLTLTENIAKAQQKLAKFMLDNAGAAEQIGAAFKVVIDLALVLAGTRGLLLLGGRLRTTSKDFLDLQRQIGATGVALRGLRGIEALMGGPWGVALFAAGTAFMVLNQQAKDFGETITDVDASLTELDKLPTKYNDVVDDIRADLDRLVDAEDKVAEAIRSQGTAAQATAMIEKQAIEGRIAKNRELADSMLILATAQLQEAETEVSGAADAFASEYGSLTRGQRVAVQGVYSKSGGDRDAMMRAVREQNIELIEEEIKQRVAANKDLTAIQIEFIKDQRKLKDAEARVDAARDKIAILERATAQETLEGDTGDAALAERLSRKILAAQQKQATADANLLAEYDKNTAKLTTLKKQREEAAEALAGAVSDGNESLTASWLAALDAIDKQIESVEGSMVKPQERLETMIAEVREMRRLMEAIPVDKSGEARDVLEEMERRLLAAQASGEKLDLIELGGLHGQFTGVLKVVNTLLESMNLLGASVDEINAKQRTTLDVYSQYSSSRVAGEVMAARSGVNAASALIRKHEGFRSTPYNDPRTDRNGKQVGPNIWRAGWGSNTFTRSDQSIGYVRQGVRVSQADADRDLERRIKGYMQIIQRQVGRDRFAGLSAPQQGVLAGLLHNYGEGALTSGGSLGGVLKAIRSGANRDVVAQQIARLGSHNGGINRKRRNEEAAIFGNADAVFEEQNVIDEQTEKKNVALEEENRLREKSLEVRQNLLKAGMEDAERRQFEIELMGKTASEQAYLTTRYELMNRAKADGIDLDEKIAGSTRTYREEIEALARAAEADTLAQEKRAAAIENTAARTEFLEQANQTLKDGLIDAIIEGDNFADVLGNVAKMLAKAALQAALFGEGPFGNGGGGALTPLFSGFSDFIGSLFANGGIMTSSGPMDLPMRAYSKGGIANSPQVAIYGEGKTPEAYVPLPDGRTIPVTLNLPDMDRLGSVPSVHAGAGGGGLQVHIHENAADGQHEVDYSPQEGRLDVRLSRAMSEGIASGSMDKALNGRFGLKPTPKGR